MLAWRRILERHGCPEVNISCPVPRDIDASLEFGADGGPAIDQKRARNCKSVGDLCVPLLFHVRTEGTSCTCSYVAQGQLTEHLLPAVFSG